MSRLEIRLIATELFVGRPSINLKLVGVAAEAATKGLEAAETSSANFMSCRRLISCSLENLVIIPIYRS
ncbi:MAG: hypothetical protein ACO3QQ_06625 [Candidatus Nanopelagicaceae bacterium]